LTIYRNQASEYGKRANEAEKAERFDLAYEYYMLALDVMMHLYKYDINPQLVKVYREKMGQYMARAEYIKKMLLDLPD